MLEAGKLLPQGAEKESSVIANSKILHNEVGLAPGFFFEKGNKKDSGLARSSKGNEYDGTQCLFEKYSNMILLTKTLEIRGIPEGILDEQAHPFFKMSNPSVALTSRKNAFI